jgi:hypothetical protein
MTYTAMKPDAPVTSTLDPDLIAGIVIGICLLRMDSSKG